MFTGLIQALGTLHTRQPNVLQITCDPDTSNLIVPELALGDSVAVNGVCLTVTEILPQGFIADASPETLARSTLSSQQNAHVNLELSLRVGSKLGGHFVTGHVDGIGTLHSSVETSTSWEMTFTTTTPVARYIISKGSIAINGISLTVAQCSPDGTYFTVAVIPHTYAITNLHLLHPGNPVNLEGDILGKYVEKFLSTETPYSSTTSNLNRLTSDFFVEHGYL